MQSGAAGEAMKTGSDPLSLLGFLLHALKANQVKVLLFELAAVAV